MDVCFFFAIVSFRREVRKKERGERESKIRENHATDKKNSISKRGKGTQKRLVKPLQKEKKKERKREFDEFQNEVFPSLPHSPPFLPKILSSENTQKKPFFGFSTPLTIL